jgi:hypothetical protein
MSNLFDCDEEDNGGGGWARDQHLCLDCVKAFVKEHIVSWWRRSLALCELEPSSLLASSNLMILFSREACPAGQLLVRRVHTPSHFFAQGQRYRYGWNCRTQTHKPAHAEKLNHLCVPTRGAANV